jgi:hypothetical protein
MFLVVATAAAVASIGAASLGDHWVDISLKNSTGVQVSHLDCLHCRAQSMKHLASCGRPF